jgi:hypothetical protein
MIRDDAVLVQSQSVNSRLPFAGVLHAGQADEKCDTARGNNQKASGKSILSQTDLALIILHKSFHSFSLRLQYHHRPGCGTYFASKEFAKKVPSLREPDSRGHCLKWYGLSWFE